MMRFLLIAGCLSLTSCMTAQKSMEPVKISSPIPTVATMATASTNVTIQKNVFDEIRSLPTVGAAKLLESAELFHYLTESTMEYASNFYRQELIKRGWKLIDTYDGGKLSMKLTFAKENERILISFGADGQHSFAGEQFFVGASVSIRVLSEMDIEQIPVYQPSQKIFKVPDSIIYFSPDKPEQIYPKTLELLKQQGWQLTPFPITPNELANTMYTLFMKGDSQLQISVIERGVATNPTAAQKTAISYNLYKVIRNP